MAEKLTLETASPYQLFKGDEHQMSLFLKRCRTCTHGARALECPILRILAESIVNNKTLRWNTKWIAIEKGWPVCISYNAKGEKDGRTIQQT